MYICQIKRSAGNFFLTCANEYFFVSGLSNQKVSLYGNQNVTKNFPVVCDGYVKYEEAEVNRSAIMQDFRDNEKKIKNGRLAAILDFISAKFVMGYPCVRPYILFCIHGTAILHFFEFRKYHKLLKFKMAAKRPFRNCSLPKVNQVIG